MTRMRIVALLSFVALAVSLRDDVNHPTDY